MHWSFVLKYDIVCVRGDMLTSDLNVLVLEERSFIATGVVRCSPEYCPRLHLASPWSVNIFSALSWATLQQASSPGAKCSIVHSNVPCFPSSSAVRCSLSSPPAPSRCPFRLTQSPARSSSALSWFPEPSYGFQSWCNRLITTSMAACLWSVT